MADFEKLPFASRETSASSKPLGTVEINGEKREYYIPDANVPDLYVVGISEPIIKVDIDFTPGEGWKVVDLVENPEMQDVIGQLHEERYKYYVEEVQGYVRHLNKTRPNG